MPSVVLRYPAHSMSLPPPVEAHGVGAGQSGNEIRGVSSSDLFGLERSMTRVLRIHALLTRVSDWKARDFESGDQERTLLISGALVANCHVVEAPVTRSWTTIACGASVMSVNVWYAAPARWGSPQGRGLAQRQRPLHRRGGRSRSVPAARGRPDRASMIPRSSHRRRLFP